MNVSFRHLQLPPWVACLLFLVAWCWPNPQVQAQMLQSAVVIEQNTQWLTQSEAIAKLKTEVQTLQQQFSALPHNSAEYYDSLRRQAYYKGIIQAIQQGSSVSAALDTAINAAASLGGTQEVAFTPKGVLRALHNQTRLLLSS